MIGNKDLEQLLSKAAREAAQRTGRDIPACRAELVQFRINGDERIRLRMTFDTGEEKITQVRTGDIYPALVESIMTAEDDSAKYAGLLRAVKNIVKL